MGLVSSHRLPERLDLFLTLDLPLTFLLRAMPDLLLDPQTQRVTVNDESPTISILWDQAVQQVVMDTKVGPTIAARAYAIVHTAMFDAWAAYDPLAIATQLGDDLQRPVAENTLAHKTEAMSYAAYAVLMELFPSETDTFTELMHELGYAPGHPTDERSMAAHIGQRSAAALMAFRRQDGANQTGEDPRGEPGIPYSDTSGYEPDNDVGQSQVIDRWTPERVPIDAPPGEAKRIQQFLTPHWGEVQSFSLEANDQFRPVAPQPFLLEEGTVDLDDRTINLADGSVVNIRRGLVGEVINPAFIEQAEQVVEASANLSDRQKLIAEFWEDAGGTSFPPGTWMTFGQFVSARDDHTLDEDAQLFFALGNAVFDASIATWEAKRYYDYARPVRVIRDLGELGLIGQFDAELGGYAIPAWAGVEQGTQTILAKDFLPYQTPGSDPSPPFAEYVSGHSTFSAAGATILELFANSDEFDAAVTFAPGSSRFEPGYTPHTPITLDWPTFSGAANEAGRSRIYGGIHFPEADLYGRQLGQQVAAEVFEEALFYINGGQQQAIQVGSRDRDCLTGTAAADRLYGRAGADRLWGSRGDDALYGGDGRDRLYGGNGQDWLDGGPGIDLYHGGSGADTFKLESSQNSFDWISDFQIDTDVLQLPEQVSYGALHIAQRGRYTFLGSQQDPMMAILKDVNACELSEAHFVTAGAAIA